MNSAAPRPDWAVTPLLLLPGALTVYLAFNSGGYFAGASSFAALVVALVLLLRMVAADAPLEGLARPAALAAAALMLLGVWQLLSAGWSDSSSRALLEFNRTVLYVLVLVLFGSMAYTPRRLRWMIWGLAGAITAVCAAGFLTRALPDVFEIAPAVQNERLSYPIGYWNALGLITAVGIVLCFHLTSSAREPLAARMLSAAALPVLGATLLFTYARGPLAALVVGLFVYILAARPRGLLGGLLGAGVPTAVAAVAAYRADLLASKEPTTAAAAAQGHDVALVVLGCTVAAFVFRRLLLGLDVRMVNIRLGPGTARRLALGVAAVVAIGAAVLVADGGFRDEVDKQANRFVESDVLQTGDQRDRLTDPGLNRLEQWEVALNGYEDAPLRGQGAGTYALLWDRDKPIFSDREEAHSLYLESLGEVGLVGTLLLVAALVTLLVGLALRVPGPERALHAAVLAAVAMWLVHAGVDWDWEVPAATLWLFALAGLALAAKPDDTPRPGLSAGRRVGLAIACVALGATPAAVAVSQARLAESINAYGRGDCATTTDRALASLDALGNRPEPYEVLGYCRARLGQVEGSEAAMASAVERDPRNWEYRFGLALVRAAGGRDPRPAAREALRLNPREPRANQAVEVFATDDPRAWRRAASRLRVAIP